MNGSSVTLDTNVLVYCVQVGDHRQAPAVRLVDLAVAAGCPLTVQSVGEFFVSASRKQLLPRRAAAAQARRWLALFPRIVAPSVAAVTVAIEAAETGRFAYWDALLLATAAEAGCTALISEDMAPGATLGPVRVVPAFAGDLVSPEALALLGAG